jgi:exopolysaccharide biosynthesis predicted pyruvyltransferase EpsI
MAFWLDGQPYLDELRSATDRSHLLLVERFDVERPGLDLRHHWVVRARSKLPRSAKTALRPLLLRSREVRRSRLEDELRQWYRSGDPQLPIRKSDVSDQRRYSFEEFERIIVGSCAVLSQRLHVGILAALLGIPVIFDDTGYRKIRDIFDQSLRRFPNAALLTEIRQPTTTALGASDEGRDPNSL